MSFKQATSYSHQSATVKYTPSIKLPIITNRTSMYNDSHKEINHNSQLSTEISREIHCESSALLKAGSLSQSRSYRFLSSQLQSSDSGPSCNRPRRMISQDYSISSDELEDHYSPREAKYHHDSIGEINLPRKNFQIADYKDALPTSYSTARIEVNDTKVQQVKDSLFKMILAPSKTKRNYQASLKSSIKQLKNLNIKSDELWMLDNIISKKPYDKPNSRLFLNACKEGNVQVVEELLGENKYLIHAFDSNGMTGLHWAAMRNHTEIIKILLARNAFIDVVDYVLFT